MAENVHWHAPDDHTAYGSYMKYPGLLCLCLQTLKLVHDQGAATASEAVEPAVLDLHSDGSIVMYKIIQLGLTHCVHPPFSATAACLLICRR